MNGKQGSTAGLAWAIAGVAAGIVLTLAMVIDPMGWHLLDRFVTRRAAETDTNPAPGVPTQLYSCGMHPEVIQDHPGTCPICGMDLTPLAHDAVKSESSGPRKILFYRNPMTPTVTSPVPMKDEMGMDYVPVYTDEVEGAVSEGAVVTIDPVVVQNMNVRTETVVRGDVVRAIRTVGYLDYDQQKMVSVTTKYSGFVEKVYVNYVGEPVTKGQRLFEIYSPELVQTEQELLSAHAFARRLAGAPAETRMRAESLVEAARRRLSYWDVSNAQVERMLESGDVVRTLAVTAPASGVVMKRMVGLEGMAVKPGMELFHLADLSTLWLSVEVFEDQLPWLSEGSEATITLSYFPGEAFIGKVRFVEPQVSEKTRTVGLRLEVPNAAGKLRSGMYATVHFTPVMAHDVVSVPALALLRTGERNLVVVALGDGRFAPREVEVGAQGDDVVEIRAGLEAGDEIVTSSQFLIDSESNLREAIQKLLAKKKLAAGAGDAR